MNQATPARKLEEVLHLAELCIEVLQQNEEHHAEVMVRFNCFIVLPMTLCHSGNNTEEVAYPWTWKHIRPFTCRKPKTWPINTNPVSYKGYV